MSMRVDSAYVNAQLLLQAQEQGITLVGPTHQARDLASQNRGSV